MTKEKLTFLLLMTLLLRNAQLNLNRSKLENGIVLEQRRIALAGTCRASSLWPDSFVPNAGSGLDWTGGPGSARMDLL